MTQEQEKSFDTPVELRPFVDLGNILLEEHGVTDLLETVVAISMAAVPGVSEASVSVRTGVGHRVETATASSPTIHELDESQYENRRGPCVFAIESAEEVRSEFPDDRWPQFSETAATLGVRSVWSVPFQVHDTVTGALNLYSKGDPAWADRSPIIGRLLADRAGVLLANATALARAEQAKLTLSKALETRTVIGQAQGVLIARQGIAPDEAFDILRRASQRTNRKLRDVAAEIVASAGRASTQKDDGTDDDPPTEPADSPGE